MLMRASIIIGLVLLCAGRAEADPAAPRTLAAPSPWPSTVQIGAPSINSASPDLLDHGGFPAIAGVAWDERLEKGPDDRAITLDVTPLAIARIARLDGPGAQASAPDTDLLSRVSARVTLGGPPQKISRRYPGRAGRPSNHVTSELKCVLLGDRAARDGDGTLLALALAADNVATGYGLDRYGATLIAERGGPCLWTANGGYRVVERFHTRERIEETKLATGVQWRLFGIAEHPMELALSGGCLLRERSEANWQDGASLDVPITRELKLSAAMRRSERPELPGQDTMREVVSLAMGLDGPSR